MKKLQLLLPITLIAAALLISCGKSESNTNVPADTATPAISAASDNSTATATLTPAAEESSTPSPTSEPVAVDTPVDPDIPDFSGSWYEIFAHKGFLTLVQDGYQITVTGTWPSSANEVYEYSFSGTLDPETYIMEYTDGICTINTYETTETYTTAAGYENGTGRIVFTEEGLEWYDDMNDADDLGSPSYFSHTASGPDDSSADETGALDGSEAAGIADITGDWYEELAGRGHLHIEQEGDLFIVTGEWPCSAAETYTYTLSGTFDLSSSTLEYADCSCSSTVYETADKYTTKVIYENGTGRLVFSEAGMEWYDDTQETADPSTFIKQSDVTY